VRQSPQSALLADGRRLHLQHGPIDLIVAAYGSRTAIADAYAAASRRFAGLLDELCDELVLLRAAADPARCRLQGRVAQRMHAAVRPYAARGFITPMAAVAGAVAEDILDAMCEAAPLDKAYVNNGGDIALHLTDGENFAIGLVDRPDRPSLFGTATLTDRDPSRGIATSGWRGRSFSLGIADAVTVLARTAAAADAAATVIANAVDLPDHPAVTRVPANALHCDSDLGARLVTRDVAPLGSEDIRIALSRGQACARTLRREGLIDAAALHLAGVTVLCGGPVRALETSREPAHA
jgi:ApbE superfamily uncharacterized protein (UPF0280 family)